MSRLPLDRLPCGHFVQHRRADGLCGLCVAASPCLEHARQRYAPLVTAAHALVQHWGTVAPAGDCGLQSPTSALVARLAEALRALEEGREG